MPFLQASPQQKCMCLFLVPTSLTQPPEPHALAQSSLSLNSRMKRRVPLPPAGAGANLLRREEGP